MHEKRASAANAPSGAACGNPTAIAKERERLGRIIQQNLQLHCAKKFVSDVGHSCRTRAWLRAGIGDLTRWQLERAEADNRIQCAGRHLKVATRAGDKFR